MNPLSSRPDPSPPCERCGRPGVTLGRRVLCAACYFIGNSCCPEFGEYDQWANTQSPPAPGSCGRLHRSGLPSTE